MGETRIAVVGAGQMGAHHARVASASNRAQLSLIVDPNGQAGQALAQRYGVGWAPELPEYLDVDAVVIASATEAHFVAAERTIGAAIPTLIEKPITPDLESTQRLISLSETKSSVLMCGFLERFNPAVITARTMIDRPFHLSSVRHSPYTPRIKTHVAWDLLVHDVDLAMSFFKSSTVDVHAVSTRVRPESLSADISDAVLRFDDSGVASFSASRVSQRKVRSMVIAEGDRILDLDLLRRNITIVKNVTENLIDDGRGYRQEAIIELPELITAVEPLTAQFTHFLDLVEGTESADVERSSLARPHEVVHRIVAAS